MDAGSMDVAMVSPLALLQCLRKHGPLLGRDYACVRCLCHTELPLIARSGVERSRSSQDRDRSPVGNEHDNVDASSRCASACRVSPQQSPFLSNELEPHSTTTYPTVNFTVWTARLKLPADHVHFRKGDTVLYKIDPKKPNSTKRPVSDGAERMLGVKWPCRDKGFIRLVDYLGSDSRIVQSARSMYGARVAGMRKKELLGDLFDREETRPFERVTFTFHLWLPAFIVQRLDGQYNIHSDEMIETYWQADLNDLFRFILQAQMDERAQPEIRTCADTLSTIVYETVPLTYEAFEEHRLGAKRFSRSEVEVLKCIAHGDIDVNDPAELERCLMKQGVTTKTQHRRFLKKLGIDPGTLEADTAPLTQPSLFFPAAD